VKSYGFLKLWGVWLLVQAAALYFFTLDYASVAGGPNLCLAKNLGFASCWGCGTTRCMWLLAHGQWAAAWQLNKLSFITFTLFAVFDLRWFIKLLKLQLAASNARMR